jgi:bifunctional DNA-binding transcriptional regulator/antitoxin component of YhaV-PrlF toxin-antitoxin module
MAALTFASTLRSDGSLTIPRQAVEELGIHPGDEVCVRVESKTENNGNSEPTALALAIASMINRTPEQVAKDRASLMAMTSPARPLPPGKTLADVICGQWPGYETDEQIYAALEELS